MHCTMRRYTRYGTGMDLHCLMVLLSGPGPEYWTSQLEFNSLGFPLARRMYDTVPVNNATRNTGNNATRNNATHATLVTLMPEL